MHTKKTSFLISYKWYRSSGPIPKISYQSILQTYSVVVRKRDVGALTCSKHKPCMSGYWLMMRWRLHFFLAHQCMWTEERAGVVEYCPPEDRPNLPLRALGRRRNGMAGGVASCSFLPATPGPAGGWSVGYHSGQRGPWSPGAWDPRQYEFMHACHYGIWS
jgi:hypothetical protein